VHTVRGLALVVAAAVGAAGCGGGGQLRATHGQPDLADFLRRPVATPSVCPADVNGTTAGRRSPWVGTVDVSVFLEPGAGATGIADLGRRLRATPVVRTVYFESQPQAYAEFQRLYTCSSRVPAGQVPASYRLVLTPHTGLGTRDELVRKILAMTGVATVSCDPSSPCVDVVAPG
jgi:hypothetical protein